MRRVIHLTYVLVVAVSSALADDEGDLFKRAKDAFDRARFSEARPLLDEFLKLYPSSTQVPSALYSLAQCALEGDKAEAERYLWRIVEEFPKSPVVPSATYRILEIKHWGFSDLPSRVPLGPSSGIQVSLKGTSKRQAPSIFSFYRVPKDACLEAIEESWRADSNHFDPRDLKPDSERLVFLSQTQLPYSRNGEEELEVPWTAPGIYIVKEEIEGLHTSHVVHVQTFAVFCRDLGETAFVYAVDPWSGVPINGLDLEIETQTVSFRGKTNNDGLYLFRLPSDSGKLKVVATRGDEVQGAVLLTKSTEAASLVYISTDRPIYRPGQAVRFKAVRRDRRDEKLEMGPRGSVRVDIQDPEGRMLQSQDYEWSDRGSLSGSFQLADEPPLGEYKIIVHVERSRRPTFDSGEDPDEKTSRLWKKSVLVSAYRKPELQVTVRCAEWTPALGSKVRAQIQAQYFFGAPVADAEVAWTVSREPFAEIVGDPWLPRAPVNDHREWIHEGGSKKNWEKEVVAEGKGRTGSDGALEFFFDSVPRSEPGAPEALKEATYEITAVVRDASRLTTKGESRVQLLPPVALRTAASRLFYQKGESLRAEVKAMTAAREPLMNREIELTAFLGLEDVQGGREFESFFTRKGKTDGQGFAIFELPLELPGLIRLRARSRDAEGRAYEDRTELWCVDPDEKWQEEHDEPASCELRILPDRVIYEPGETCHLLVRWLGKPLSALLSLEGEKFHDVRVVRITHPWEILEIPIREEYAPNLFLKLEISEEGIASGFEIFVYPQAKFLDVQVATDKTSYRPREKVNVSVVIRASGVPAESEVELAVVDESIFALARDTTTDIRSFFYPLRENDLAEGERTPGDSFFRVNVTSHRNRWTSTHRSGGMAMDMATATESALQEGEQPLASLIPASVRNFFPDTLYWAGQVKTGNDGKAEVQIELPDTLTRWRILAKAISSVDRFGGGSGSLVARKNLVLRLVAPRFYTERDEGVVSTIVHNHLEQDLEVLVRLQVEGADLSQAGEGTREKSVKLAGGKEARLDWRVSAVHSSKVRLIAEALSAVESDGMEVQVPVHPHGSEKRVSASGRVDGTWRKTLVLPEEAALESAQLEVIQTSGLGAIAKEALPYLAGYPYGCVEQTMSRFLPAIIALEAMKRLGIQNESLERDLPAMVSNGLQRLYGFQHEEGGWGWWKNDSTHPFMTAYVVHALAITKKAGFPIDEGTLQRGCEALKAMTSTPFGLYARALAGDSVEEELALFEPQTASDRAYLILGGREELAKDLPSDPPASPSVQAVLETALIVRAMASVNSQDPRIDPLVQWILSQREGATWFSTLETANVLYALMALPMPAAGPRVDLRVNGKLVKWEGARALVGPADLKRGENLIELNASAKGPKGSAFGSAILGFRTKGEGIPAEPGEIIVERRFERSRKAGNEAEWAPLSSGEAVKIGDEVRAFVTVRTRSTVHFVLVELPFPAGTEPMGSGRDEESSEERESSSSWYCREEFRDDRVALAAETLLEGEKYEYAFTLRPTLPGEYHVRPAIASSMYDPEMRGASDEFLLQVKD